MPIHSTTVPRQKNEPLGPDKRLNFPTEIFSRHKSGQVYKAVNASLTSVTSKIVKPMRTGTIYYLIIIQNTIEWENVN